MTEENKQKLLAAGYGRLIEWAENPLLETGYAGSMFQNNKEVLVDRRKFPGATPVAPASDETLKNIITIAPVIRLTFKDVPRLTKENFFSHVWEISHGAFQMFCDWIDEYKKRIGWDFFFTGALYVKSNIKFHDMPIAMQIGIFMEFFFEQGVTLDPLGGLDDILYEIMEWFYELGEKKDTFEEEQGTTEGLIPDGN